jgi:hypothetical protein
MRFASLVPDVRYSIAASGADIVISEPWGQGGGGGGRLFLTTCVNWVLLLNGTAQNERVTKQYFS